MINLVKDTLDNTDIDQLINWLKTYPRLTKGPLTLDFETQWANYVGTKYATYVNSGSSANLLALYSLLEIGKLNRNDVIVVPSVSWATDLAPVFQLGLTPVLCDVNLNDLAIDINHFKKIIHTHKPKALMLVHVLGLVCDIDEIKSLCEENNIILIEDTCESTGSKFNNNILGSFGDISTFSFYFGHHMSTIEGGMVCTNNKEFDNLFRSIRNHGWDRDWDSNTQKTMREMYNISEFDSLYTFYYSGFNFRATDLQAFLGLNQLKKINDFSEKRNNNYNLYQSHIKNSIWKPKIKNNVYVSNFAWPLLVHNKVELATIFKKNNIECRPLICGSMGKQPFYTKRMGECDLPNANLIHTNGMYVPNHQSMTENEVLQICNIINDTAITINV
jgi:CDP-6-deoxy-D-xylo-4-hexulose-3-dehydrase